MENLYVDSESGDDSPRRRLVFGDTSSGYESSVDSFSGNAVSWI
jgi:hypothetical protein